MAERIAEAYAQVIPTTTGIGAALSTEFAGVGGLSGKAMGGGILTSLKSFVGPMAATFATVGLVNFAKDSVKAASDLAEAGTAVGTIFGNSYGEIEAWSKTAATALGQSQLEALNAAKTFAVFGTAAGVSGGDLVDFSTGLAGVATDLASFHNTSPEEAIHAIGAALRGESEPIRKYGILLNDAALKQKALEMGIYDGNGTLTAQQKVLAANALIYDQAGVALGDFDRTSEGFANQQRIMAAQFENLKGKVGDLFLPVMTTLAKVMTEQILPAAGPFIDWISTAGTEFFKAAGSMSPLGVMFKTLGDFLPVLIPYFVQIGDAFRVVAEAVMPVLVNLFGIFVNEILPLVLTLFETLSPIISNMVTQIADMLVPVIATLGELFAAIIPTLTDLIENVLPILSEWWGFLAGVIVGAVGLAIGIIQFLAEVVLWLWEYVVDPVIGFIAGAVTFLWEFVIQPVFALIGAAWGMFAWFVNQAWIIISPIFRLLGGIFLWLWETIISPVFGWIGGVFSDLWGIVSDVFGAIGDFIETTFKNIVGFVRGPVNTIIDLINGMIRGLNSVKITIPDWVPGIGGEVWGFNIPTIPKLAKGGTLTTAGSVMVGEQGPEILSLPRGATVTPLDKTGGGVVNYYAAPNNSISAEDDLLMAMRRAKVVAGW